MVFEVLLKITQAAPPPLAPRPPMCSLVPCLPVRPAQSLLIVGDLPQTRRRLPGAEMPAGCLSFNDLPVLLADLQPFWNLRQSSELK